MMMPASQYSGNDAIPVSPHAMKHGRSSRSTTWAAVLFTAIRRTSYILSVWQKRSASRRQLARLDDHLLRDIGLTRADAEQEIMKSFWQV
jgi:uncharacterized protein YjiS (DUF1127 family)